MSETNKTYLGIDYGAKRIGLAVGTKGGIAQPLITLVADKPDYWQQLESVLADHDVEGLVVGLPRSLDGNETAQTNAARFFARELASFKLPVHLQDEAATSSLARERLGAKAAKEAIDAEAAAIILQDFLDSYEKA